tara:strand:- start:128 stop:2122 length:1995 start_codon:yes stop_codon:yes gene_type:complete
MAKRIKELDGIDVVVSDQMRIAVDSDQGTYSTKIKFLGKPVVGSVIGKGAADKDGGGSFDWIDSGPVHELVLNSTLHVPAANDTTEGGQLNLFWPTEDIPVSIDTYIDTGNSHQRGANKNYLRIFTYNEDSVNHLLAFDREDGTILHGETPGSHKLVPISTGEGGDSFDPSTLIAKDNNLQTQIDTLKESYAHVGEKPPTSYVKGKLWWDTNNATMYVYDGSAWVAASPGSCSGSESGGGVITSDLELTLYNPATTTPRKGARVKGLQYMTNRQIRSATTYGIAHGTTIKTPHDGWTISVPEGISNWALAHIHFNDINLDTGVADPGTAYTVGDANANGTNSICCGQNNSYNYTGYVITHGRHIAGFGDHIDGYNFNLTAKASFDVDNTKAPVYSGVLKGSAFNADLRSSGWETIDLSSVVGSRKCLVRLFVGMAGAREGTWTNNTVGTTYVQFRTPGDSLIAYPGAMKTGGGCAHMITGNGTDDSYMYGGYVLVMTDDSGRIEAVQGANTSTTAVDIGMWTSGFAPITGTNTTIQNAALGSSNIHSGSITYLGQNVGGGGGSDGLMKFKKISTGHVNSLVYLRVTTTAGAYVFARTPNDPINWFNGANYSKYGMTGIYASSTYNQGGYIAVLSDENGDIEVQTHANSHIRLDVMGALPAAVVY